MSTRTKPKTTPKQRTAPQTGSPRRNHAAMYRYFQAQQPAGTSPRRGRKRGLEWHIMGALCCGLVTFVFSVLTASSLAAAHRADADRAEEERATLMTLANNSQAAYRSLTGERALQLYLADHKMVLLGRPVEPAEVKVNAPQ
jgi:hypothetical protein